MTEERRTGYKDLVEGIKANGLSARRVELLMEGHGAKVDNLEQKLQEHDHRTRETRDAVMETRGDMKALTGHITILSENVNKLGDKVDDSIVKVAKLEKHNELQTQDKQDADDRKIPKPMIYSAAASVILFAMYHFDPAATESTVTAIKGLF
jgi:predicted  nucleic acid-binding Zn-ribbon protein